MAQILLKYLEQKMIDFANCVEITRSLPGRAAADVRRPGNPGERISHSLQTRSTLYFIQEGLTCQRK